MSEPASQAWFWGILETGVGFTREIRRRLDMSQEEATALAKSLQTTASLAGLKNTYRVAKLKMPECNV
jgi:hypothetical protein